MILTEPEYFKLYTDAWKSMPVSQQGRKLFLCLAKRMSYADANNPACSQIVYIGSPAREAVMKECGWDSKSNSAFYKGVLELAKANAIRRVSRGYIQINPKYAGKGSWKYDTYHRRGGVENLMQNFEENKEKVDA